MTGFDDRFEQTCVTLEKWSFVVKIMVFIDTVQTMILPFIIILVTNLLIMFKLMRKFSFKKRSSFQKRFNDQNARKKQNIYNKMARSKKGSLVSNQSIVASISTNKHKKTTISKETTKTLLIIATTFLILNFPIASTKTYYFFMASSSSFDLKSVENKSNETNLNNIAKMNNSFSEKTTRDSEFSIRNKTNLVLEDYLIDITKNFSSYIEFTQDDYYTEPLVKNLLNKTNFVDMLNLEMSYNQRKEILEKIASLIYYINFSINFFLYTFNTSSNSQFREIFFHLFKRSKTILFC
jgi:hypothetical protein